MGFLDSSGLTRLWNKIKSKFVTGISYDSTTRKLKQTVNGVTTDVATLNTMKVVTVTQNGTTLSYGALSNTEYNAIIEALPNVILHVVRYNDSPLYLNYNKNDTYGSSSDQYLHFTGMYASSNGCITVEGRILKQETSIGEHNVSINNTEVYSTSNINTLLNQKQPTLTFDSTPTANSNNPVKSSGIKTYVDTAITNVVEIAEGKTKNYVIDTTVTGTDLVNTSFNSNLQELRVDYSKNIQVFGHSDPVNLFDLKVGDIISITQTNVPDRWLGGFAGGEAIFLPLEIKLDIDTTVTQNSTNPVSSGAVYTALHEDIGYVEITADSGTLTTVQYAEVQKKYCIIVNTSTGLVFTKVKKHIDSASPYVFTCIGTGLANNVISIYDRMIIVQTSRTYTLFTSEYTTYTKANVDTLVNAKYTKPSSGIPSSDLASAVQTSLDKADGSVQSTDYITDSEIDAICI